jgi:hypothetical protein
MREDGGKDEHRPSEIEEKKAFHGVKTSNVSPSRRLLRAGGQHRPSEIEKKFHGVKTSNGKR